MLHRYIEIKDKKITRVTSVQTKPFETTVEPLPKFGGSVRPITETQYTHLESCDFAIDKLKSKIALLENNPVKDELQLLIDIVEIN